MFLELDRSCNCTHSECIKYHRIVHFKVANFMLHEFCINFLKRENGWIEVRVSIGNSSKYKRFAVKGNKKYNCS